MCNSVGTLYVGKSEKGKQRLCFFYKHKQNFSALSLTQSNEILRYIPRTGGKPATMFSFLLVNCILYSTYKVLAKLDISIGQ